MEILAVNELIRARFAEEWDSDATITRYDNDKAQPIPSGEPFVRFAIRFNEETAISAGNQDAVHELTGRVHLNIFTPNEMGDYDGLYLAQRFKEIFRNLEIVTDDIQLKFYTALGPTFIPSTDQYHGLNISVYFEALYLA